MNREISISLFELKIPILIIWSIALGGIALEKLWRVSYRGMRYVSAQ